MTIKTFTVLVTVEECDNFPVHRIDIAKAMRYGLTQYGGLYAIAHPQLVDVWNGDKTDPNAGEPIRVVK
jgi:hypothetical protein